MASSTITESLKQAKGSKAFIMKGDRKTDPKKYVNVMADYMSTGIWHLDGSMMEFDELPVCDKTKRRLDDMISEYDGIPSTQDPDELDFSTKSWKIGREIKLQLPDWKVEFYNFKNQLPFYSSITCRSEVEVSSVESFIFRMISILKVP